MSTSLLTKPVVYVQSASNGVITCIERRMRPEDFGNIFPTNQFPTFPAIDASLTRPVLPIELAYGVIPKGVKLPNYDPPSEQWEATEKYWLHTVQTNGYVLGQQTTFDHETAFYTDRVLTYKADPPPSDIPYYNPNDYNILEPVGYPIDLTRDIEEEAPRIITVIPKGVLGTIGPIAWASYNNWASYYTGTVGNEYLYLWEGGIWATSPEIHLIKDGVGQSALISYVSTGQGCAIYGHGPEYAAYLTSDAVFQGQTEYEYVKLEITKPESPIMSHVIAPTEESSILSSLVCLGGFLGLLVLGVSANDSAAAAAARKRIRRETK